MNKRLLFCLVASVLTLAELPDLRARSASYLSADGLVFTMDVQANQTVLTLTGQPFANCRIDCTQQFNGWNTLTNATLNGSGTFVYVDGNNFPICFYRVLSAVSFVSVGAQDGRVTDNHKNPGDGAAVNATDNSGSALRAGDVGGNEKQHKAVVSFDTSSIPDGATIVSATLRLRRGIVAGTNPFLTHGPCWLDIKGGTGFSGSAALELADFQSPADAAEVGALSNAASDGDWSASSINSIGLGFLNKIGTTQFRISFSVHDNEDGKADYMGWYSGENATPANRPVLEVLYR